MTLAALEEVVGAGNFQYLADGVCKREREESGLSYVDLEQIIQQWESLENYLRKSDFSAVVRSTSEDVSGTNVEDLVSIAAQNTDTPLFVVEDFPGNYWPKPGRALNGLFTEAGPGQDIHRSRGVDPSLIHNLSNPRYAALGDIKKEKHPGGDPKLIRAEERNRHAMGRSTRRRQLLSGFGEVIATVGEARGVFTFPATP